MKDRDNIFIKGATSFTTSNRGFTLIELIAVIIIIGIVSRAVVLNVGNVVEQTRLKNAANIAMADLRYAQESGMNKGRPVKFTVNASTNRYYAVYSDNNESVLNADGNPIDRTFNTGDFADVDITSTETGSNLTFSSIGRPSLGSGYFTYKTVMSLNNDAYTIYIMGSGLSSFEEGSSGKGCGC